MLRCGGQFLFVSTPHPEMWLLRAGGGETRGGQQVWPDPQDSGLSDHRVVRAVGCCLLIGGDSAG